MFASPRLVRADRFDDHVRNGNVLVNAQKFAEAAREFEAAYKLKAQPDLALNLGRLYLKLGRGDAARSYCAVYLTEESDPPEDRKAKALDCVKQARRMAPKKETAAAAPPAKTAPAAPVGEAGPAAVQPKPPAEAAQAPAKEPPAAAPASVAAAAAAPVAEPVPTAGSPSEPTVDRPLSAHPAPPQSAASAVELAAEASAARGPRPLWRKVAGGIGLGAGAGLMAYGIAGLVLDGRCQGAPFSQNPVAQGGVGGSCSLVYDTVPAGAALLGVGAAVAIGATVLLALPGPAQPVLRRRVALVSPVRPLPGAEK